VQVNVNPTPAAGGGAGGAQVDTDAPEIRKYKKKFSGEILCAALWGVNLLIGTDSGLMLLDRSGQGKVYQLITRRRFDQMAVLEGQNILVTISGRKRRIRVYYLSWLKQKILRTEGVRHSYPLIHSLPYLLPSLADREAKWMGECGRFARCRPLQDRSLRTNQVPRRRHGNVHRNLRLGPQTLSQVHGIQGDHLFFDVSLVAIFLARPSREIVKHAVVLFFVRDMGK
jgi:hypothetical protein